jgi:miniconductance mechanosensitive channel
MKSLGTQFTEWIMKAGISEDYAQLLQHLTLLILFILLAWLADFVTRKTLVNSFTRYARKTKAQWDDILLERKVFTRLSHLAPGLVIYFYTTLNLESYEQLTSLLHYGVYIYITLVSLLTIDALLNALHDIYLTLPVAKDRPIKGYVQSVKIVFYFIGIILMLSILLDKSPKTLLAGLGAVAAVLLLVFRDTILGFVSSIQLSANQMVKPGDWISMPARNADGIVQEITLNTVKVQNWDKTITTLPTYSLISESFQNWKGMEEAKGRRIARSLYIDIKSVHFCTQEELTKMKQIKLIREYLTQKEKEIEASNIAQGIEENDRVSRRSLTNLGIFRNYIMIYLEHHPKVQPNRLPYITMVRHLQPTEKGLPMQIYAFSKETSWANYEELQADIFDHIFAVAPEFGIRLFQNPSSEDFRHFLTRTATDNSL